MFKRAKARERKARDNMPEVYIPEHVRLLIAWIRLIIATGAFVEDESKKSPMRLVDEWSLIEQICTLAFAEPNEYIRILMMPWYCWKSLYKNTRYTGDRLIVLAAVRQNELTLIFASPELRGDRVIVMEAVRQNGWTLKFASPELRGDRAVVLAAVKTSGYVLKFASPELYGDREVVLAAVQNNGLALKYASEKLRADHEVVLAAVQQDGDALKYASEELRELKKEGY